MDARTRIIATLAVAFALTALPGASHALEEPTFTVKGGLSLSRIYSRSETLDPQWKRGSSGGASAEFRISEVMSIQPELLYVMKGFSYGRSEASDDGGVAGTVETFQSVDYLEFPVLLRLRVETNRAVVPHVLLGPTFAVKQRERIETRGAIGSSIQSDDIKDFDTGVVLGAGLEIGQGLHGWMIEGRFTHGLTPIEFQSVQDRNVNVQVLTGWVYRP